VPSGDPDALGHVADPTADPERALTRGALVRAVETLPERSRAVILAVDVAGLPYRAADGLGIRPGTVMSRLHRARGKLRAALTPG
jgi:RNA polymerase sigma factor (sigma-70 family)